MNFVQYFYYNGYADRAQAKLIAEIKNYCKRNYCQPISTSVLSNCNRSTLIVVFEYRGEVAKKIDTDKKILDTDKYYHKCSKCGFHLIEDEMTICPGCASHFVEDLEVE